MLAFNNRLYVTERLDKKIQAMLLPYESCRQPESTFHQAFHGNQPLHKISPLTKMLQVTVAPS
jgi:hypothetical protein